MNTSPKRLAALKNKQQKHPTESLQDLGVGKKPDAKKPSLQETEEMTELKSSAKALQKALKMLYPEQAWSLMKVQELVSQQRGFESAYHARNSFRAKSSDHAYSSDGLFTSLDSSLLSQNAKGATGQKPDLIGARVGVAKDELGLLELIKSPHHHYGRLGLDDKGQPIMLPQLKRHSDITVNSDENDHNGPFTFIMGDEQSEEHFSLQFAEQAIETGQGLTWVNARDDQAYQSLIDLACAVGREDDLRFIRLDSDLNLTEPQKEVEVYLRPFLMQSSADLLTFLQGIFRLQKAWDPEMADWFKMMVPVLCHMRDQKEILLDASVFVEYTSLINLFRVSLRRDVPAHILAPVKAFLAQTIGEDYDAWMRQNITIQKTQSWSLKHDGLIQKIKEPLEIFNHSLNLTFKKQHRQINMNPSELTPANTDIVIIELPKSGISTIMAAMFVQNQLELSLSSLPRVWKDTGHRRAIIFRDVILSGSGVAWDLPSDHLSQLNIDLIYAWSKPEAYDLQEKRSLLLSPITHLNIESPYHCRIISTAAIQSEFKRYQESLPDRITKHEELRARFQMPSLAMHDPWQWLQDKTNSSREGWIVFNKETLMSIREKVSKSKKFI